MGIAIKCNEIFYEARAHAHGCYDFFFLIIHSEMHVWSFFYAYTYLHTVERYKLFVALPFIAANWIGVHPPSSLALMLAPFPKRYPATST